MFLIISVGVAGFSIGGLTGFYIERYHTKKTIRKLMEKAIQDTAEMLKKGVLVMMEKKPSEPEIALPDHTQNGRH